ncbi:SidA/IucD/PvdA family monooxygenase [Allofrancisella guangzhouensis]|uniref:L-lysine 6-monooxygenase n=1 Tax=Allofrancisella guangzhouensis TaxID=594679 RepID=A0A0A8EBK7_9GAMM|nr:SidA/IucD/PvdA family monooxygenase [Allofrancisella guangzhouensis]AJC49526.1 L-lysine 6-monooxygenase [Allofrancisella guangzhouensis]MBK2027609.1 SidA/IucD/PvdA family monooxygenase [Allofrancisella guangzhouensis]MBK2044078.1 SidA/IucD/PvdA family monooxygenase [Allofrancisella guangzhouensis]MBK2046526.1 SidA/IucD/PvdA family monooxygenase [Allofrancisella guangzhouensis]
MKIYDVIGIGIGPFNLGLSALLNDKPINSIFFEKKESFSWHPGLMMDWTTLQVPFLADLVTMVDPTSNFSFLNYLHQKNRLYKFYFKENFFIQRQEYNDYCLWVAENCQSCKFGYEVTNIEHSKVSGNETWNVTVKNSNGEEQQYLAKNIVLGLGTKPQLPSYFSNTKNVHHSGEYLDIKAQALKDQHITLIGSGQSAGEIFLDLMKSKNDSTQISWVTRSKGFFPMEYSKLGLEHFSPEYIDYFYNLPQTKKPKLLMEQDLLYKGISVETISNIYEVLYQETVQNKNKAELISNSELHNIDCNTDKLNCFFYHNQQNEDFLIKTDRVIAATGYKSDITHSLANIEKFITKDENGNLNITRDYKLVTQDTNLNIFVQNAEMHTHGVGTPDLGLGAYRNAVIANKLLQKETYKLSSQNIFSTFGVPKKYLTQKSSIKAA